MKGTARTSAPLSWLGFLIPVVVVPSVLGVCWHYWPQIQAWATQPGSPWIIAGGCIAAVVVFAVVVIGDAIRRAPDCQRECCTDWPEDGK